MYIIITASLGSPFARDFQLHFYTKVTMSTEKKSDARM